MQASSSAVNCNGLQFVCKTNASWMADPANPPFGKKQNVELQIKNLRKDDLLFSLYGFALCLKDAKGQDVQFTHGRAAIRAVKPVLIHPGQTHVLTCAGSLRTDGQYSFSNGVDPGFSAALSPGKYQLSFQIGNSEKDISMYETVRDEVKKTGLPLWYGATETKPLEIQVIIK